MELAPKDPNKLIEWKSSNDKEKAIIDLALLDPELHHVDLDKSSKDIWNNMNKLCGAQEVNENFSLIKIVQF